LKLENKNICITGADGFIGSHLCESLLRKGANITAIDLGFKSNLKTLQSSDHGNLEFVIGDILKMSNLKSVLSNKDIIIHLAAISSTRICNQDPKNGYLTNVEGTRIILENFDHDTRFVFPSSMTVYGDQGTKLLQETDNTIGNDWYSKTKIMGEYFCQAYHHLKGLSYTILRFSNNFGPGQSSNFLVPEFIYQALTNGEIEILDTRMIRDFIYVHDCVNAIIKVLENDSTINQIINIGSGKQYSTKDIAEHISKILNSTWSDLHKPQNAPIMLALDISKIKKLTNWKPEYSLIDGLKETIDYFKQNRLKK